MRTAPMSLCMLACIGLMACSPPDPPGKKRRPEPQTSALGDARARPAIMQAADAYKDRARSAEAESLQSADRQRAEIDAQSR